MSKRKPDDSVESTGAKRSNKAMNNSQESTFAKRAKLNKKVAELKLRGIEEENDEPDDKMLSFFQFREYVRMMRRLKSFVYFHEGSDEEHPTYHVGTNIIKHAYYPNDGWRSLNSNGSRLPIVMRIDVLNKNKQQRDLLNESMEIQS